MDAAAQNLPARLFATAACHADRPAVTLGGQTLTYRQLTREIAACAASLARAGVGPGQRVAILFPNCFQFVSSYFAAQLLGATTLPLHCLQGPEEIAYVLADAEAETLLALNVFEPLIAAVRPRVPCLKRVFISGATGLADVGSFEGLVTPSRAEAPPCPAGPEDIAVLIYTSGTTGRPKGAMLTHDNLLFDADACRQVIDVTETDTFASVLPFFHSFGATICMILPLMQGAHTVLIPRFAPLAVLEVLERTRATVFAGVPSMYAVMLQMRTEREFDLGPLRIGVTGGAPMPVEVLRGFEERFGIHLIEGYGPTEASPVVTVNPASGVRKVGTTGPAIPGVTVSIRDEDFNPLPQGEVGEVCVAGRNVMKGYWRDPERTAETIRDGCLLTGDMGALDEDGYLSIVDRKKDMVIVGGMNVYPREIEEVIYRLPGVVEAAVIGIPSNLRGEDVKAFVVAEEGASLSAEAVIQQCKEHLANYKVPRTVEFRSELPKSAVGKILKRELRGLGA